MYASATAMATPSTPSCGLLLSGVATEAATGFEYDIIDSEATSDGADGAGMFIVAFAFEPPSEKFKHNNLAK